MYEDPASQEFRALWADDPKMQKLLQSNWLLNYKLQNGFFDASEMDTGSLTHAGHPLARETLLEGMERKNKYGYWARFKDFMPFMADIDGVEAERAIDTLRALDAGGDVSQQDAAFTHDWMKREWLGKTFGAQFGETIRSSYKMGAEFALLRAPSGKAAKGLRPFSLERRKALAGKTSLIGKLIPETRALGAAKVANGVKQGGFLKEVVGKGAVFTGIRTGVQELADVATPFGGPSRLRSMITRATMPEWTMTPDDEGNMQSILMDGWKPVTGGMWFDAFVQVAAEDMSEFWGFRYGDDLARIGRKVVEKPANWAWLQAAYGRTIGKVAERVPQSIKTLPGRVGANALGRAGKELKEAGGVQNMLTEVVEEFVGHGISWVGLNGKNVIVDGEEVEWEEILPGIEESAMILASTGVMVGLPMMPGVAQAALTTESKPATMEEARELLDRIATEERARAEEEGRATDEAGGERKLSQEEVEAAYDGWRGETGEEIERVDRESIEDEEVLQLMDWAEDRGVTVLPGRASKEVGGASVTQGVVMLNVNRSAAASRFDMYHELLHDFRMRNPKAARELDGMLERMAPGMRKGSLERYNERRVQAGIEPLSTDLRKKESYDEATANRAGEEGALIHMAAGDERSAKMMDDIVTNRRFVGTALLDWIKDKVNAVSGTNFDSSQQKRLRVLAARIGSYAAQHNISPALVEQLQGDLETEAGVGSVEAALALNELINILSGSPAIDPGIIDTVQPPEPEGEDVPTETPAATVEAPAAPTAIPKGKEAEAAKFRDKLQGELDKLETDEEKIAHLEAKKYGSPVKLAVREEFLSALRGEVEAPAVEAPTVEAPAEGAAAEPETTKPKAKKKPTKGKVKPEKVKEFTKTRLAKERDKVRKQAEKSGEDFDVAWKRHLQALEERFSEGDVSRLQAIRNELATLDEVEVTEAPVQEATPEAEPEQAKQADAKSDLTRRTTKGLSEEQKTVLAGLERAERKRAKAAQTLENKRGFGQAKSIADAETALTEADAELDAAEAAAQEHVEGVEAQRPAGVEREAPTRGAAGGTTFTSPEKAEKAVERATGQRKEAQDELDELEAVMRGQEVERRALDKEISALPPGDERAEQERKLRDLEQELQANQAAAQKLAKKVTGAGRRAGRAAGQAAAFEEGQRDFPIYRSPKTGKETKTAVKYGDLEGIRREAETQQAEAARALEELDAGKSPQEEAITRDIARAADRSRKLGQDIKAETDPERKAELQEKRKGQAQEQAQRKAARDRLKKDKDRAKRLTDERKKAKRAATAAAQTVEVTTGLLEEFAEEASMAGAEAVELNERQRVRQTYFERIQRAYKRLFSFMKGQRKNLRADMQVLTEALDGRAAQPFVRIYFKSGSQSQVGVVEELEASKSVMQRALERAGILDEATEDVAFSREDGTFAVYPKEEIDRIETTGESRKAKPGLRKQLEAAKTEKKRIELTRKIELKELELEAAESRLDAHASNPSGLLVLEDINTHQDLRDYIKRNLQGADKRWLGHDNGTRLSWPFFLVHSMRMSPQERAKTYNWLRNAQTTQWGERITDLQMFADVLEEVAEREGYRAESGKPQKKNKSHGLLPDLALEGDQKNKSESQVIDEAGQMVLPKRSTDFHEGSAGQQNTDLRNRQLRDRTNEALKLGKEATDALQAKSDMVAVEKLTHATAFLDALTSDNSIGQRQDLLDELQAERQRIADVVQEAYDLSDAEIVDQDREAPSVEFLGDLTDIEDQAADRETRLSVPISEFDPIINATPRGGSYNLDIANDAAPQTVNVTLRPEGLKRGIPKLRAVSRDVLTKRPAVAYSAQGAQAIADGVTAVVRNFADSILEEGDKQGGLDITVAAPSHVELLDGNNKTSGIADGAATLTQLKSLEKLLRTYPGVVEVTHRESVSSDALVDGYRKTGKVPTPKNSEIRVRLFSDVEQMRKTLGNEEFNKVERRREAANRLHNMAVRLSVPAWHGGHANIDRFSTDKIGTGEGAQAYGWGLYFTGKRKIAKWYRDKLHKRGDRLVSSDASQVLIDGVSYKDIFGQVIVRNIGSLTTPPVFGGAATDPAIAVPADITEDTLMADNRSAFALALRSVTMSVSRDQAKENLSRKMYGPNGKPHGGLSQKDAGILYGEALSWVARMENPANWVGQESGAALYAVELLPEEEDYLQWDKPLSEQSEKVQAALAKIANDNQMVDTSKHRSGLTGYIFRLQGTGELTAQEEADIEDWPSGGEHYMDLPFYEGWSEERVEELRARYLAQAEYGFPADKTGAQIYIRLAGRFPHHGGLGSKQAASLALLAEGIRGNMYLDGMSRSRGEGGYNYVIFDDADITPLDAQQGTRLSVPIHDDTAMDPTGDFDQRTTPETGLRAWWSTYRTNKQQARRRRRHAFVDDMDGAVDFHGMVAADERGELTEAGDFISQWRRYRARAEDRINTMTARHVWPLMAGLANAGITVGEFNDFLRARHQPERNASNERRDPEGFAELMEGDPETSTANAKRELATITRGRRAQMNRLGRMYDKMMRELLDARLDAGLIDQEVYDKIANAYKHYTPLKKAELLDTWGESRDLNMKGDELIASRGSATIAGEQLENSLLDMERMAIRVEKNSVGTKLVQFAKDNPWIKIFDKRVVPTRTLVYDVENGTHRQEYAGLAPIERDDQGRSISRALTIFENGKKVQYYIRPEFEGLVKSVQAEHNFTDGDIINELGGLARGMSQLHTRLNPEFVLRNMTRDILTASYMIGNEQGLGMLAQTMNPVNYTRALSSIAKLARARRFEATVDGEVQWTAENKYDEYAEEYHREGGFISFGNLREFIRVSKDLLRLERTANGQMTLGDLAKVMTSHIGALNDVVENGSRFAFYVALRENGTAAGEAALQAKEITVNFEKRGTYSRALNSNWLFSAAGILGIDRVFAGFRRNIPGAISMLGSTAVAGWLLDLANEAIGGEDEEGRLLIDRVSDQEKENNMVFLLGGLDEKGEPARITIPSPWVIRWFGNMGQRTRAWQNGRMSGDAWTAGALTGALKEVNPFGSSGYPWYVEPFTQIGANENFFGSPIARKNPFERAPMPRSQEYYDSVNPTIQKMTDTLYEWAKDDINKGDKTALPRGMYGYMDLNPEHVEHLLESFSGGAGKFFTRTFDTANKLALNKEVEVSGVPFVRSFYKEGFYKGRDRQLVYSIRGEADRAYKAMLSGARPASDQELVDAGWPYQAYRGASALAAKLSKISEARRAATSDAERKEYDILERNIMLPYLEYYFKTLRPLLKERGYALPEEVKAK